MPREPHIDSVENRRLAILHRYAALDVVADDRLDTLCRLARAIFDVPIAAISLVGRDRQWFKSRIGLDIAESARDESFCAHILGQTGPLVVEDATRDSRFIDNPFVCGDPRIRFYAGAPLISRQGETLGAICVIDTVPRQASERELAALTDLAKLTMQHMDLQLLATLDGLTGAIRREPFHQLADRDFAACRKTSRPVACLIVDADNFKAINDTHGHAAGDEVLKVLGDVCESHLSERDYLGRIGGEEFCIVLMDKAPDEALAVAEAVRESVERIVLGSADRPIRVTASIGFAVMERSDADFTTLKMRADDAMYQAKRDGRNRVASAFGYASRLTG